MTIALMFSPYNIKPIIEYITQHKGYVLHSNTCLQCTFSVPDNFMYAMWLWNLFINSGMCEDNSMFLVSPALFCLYGDLTNIDLEIKRSPHQVLTTRQALQRKISDTELFYSNIFPW